MKISAETILIFYLSPAIVFLSSLMQMPGLIYLVSGYTISLVLLILILYRIGGANISANKFIPIVIVCFLCAIEYMHYLLSGVALNGMGDVRMILYSPLYAPIIVFVLYATYLLVASDVVRIRHLNITVKLFTYFNIFFITYWFSIYFDLIAQIEFTNHMNANQISYASLFVSFVLIGFKNLLFIKQNYIKYYLIINIVVIILNTTRGALLILSALIIYYLLRHLAKKTSNELFGVLMLALGLGVTIFVWKISIADMIFGDEFIYLYGRIEGFKSEISIGSLQIYFDRGLGYDDYSVSSATRIFTNYLATILFIEEPWIGIGSAYAYSIKVLGVGIHSFNFLLLVSTGIVGLSTMVSIIYLLGKGFCVNHDKVVLLTFGLLTLLFINNLPAYFVLLLVLGAYNQASNSNELYSEIGGSIDTKNKISKPATYLC